MTVIDDVHSAMRGARDVALRFNSCYTSLCGPCPHEFLKLREAAPLAHPTTAVRHCMACLAHQAHLQRKRQAMAMSQRRPMWPSGMLELTFCSTAAAASLPGASLDMPAPQELDVMV